MSVNIGRDNADRSYRYKMPILKTKVEGRGNGIKTVIVNMVDIAKALRTPPDFPTKYFGIELGAQSKYDEKTERAVVNGSHDQPDMVKLLDGFIQKFILCPTCKLPEIKLDVRKSAIKIDCAACGHNSVLKNDHRLVTYIIKNPPKTKKKTAGTEAAAPAPTADSGGAKKKKKAGDGKTDSTDEKKEKDEDDDSAGPPEKSEDSSEKETEFFSDTSKEAQRKRKEAEFSLMRGSADDQKQKTVDSILEGAKSENKSESPATVLQVFLAGGDRSVMDITSELRRLQLARGFDDPTRVKVLLEAVIDRSNPKTIVAQFKKRAALFKQFAADRQAATVLLQCIEELVGVISPQLLSRTPMILQTLYEEEVLDEEAIVAWALMPPESSWIVNREVATKVRHVAQPFIDWLQNAEEDEDGEEE